MNASEREALVAEYYQRIDRGDVDWVLSLFAPEAVYDRAETSYRGLAQITEFYQHQRGITGVHEIDTVATHDLTTIAQGVFDGRGRDGSARKVGFADSWRFTLGGLVLHRKTFLAIGSQYVRE
ncbi:MAG: nuclear transport factor 2 family protein [Pseudomonadota bacterium]